MRQLRIHADHVRCVAYSPDGKLLATASNDRSVRLLDTATGKVVAKWADLGGIMQAVAFSKDGRWLAFGGQTRNVYHVGMDDLAARPTGVDLGAVLGGSSSRSVTSLTFINDDRQVLIGTGDRILSSPRSPLYVWQPWGMVTASKNVRGGVHHLALHPDGNRVAIGTGFGWLHAAAPNWAPDGVSGEAITAMAVAFSPDASLLAVGLGWRIVIEDVATRAVLRRLKGHKAKVTSLAFTPDGLTLLSGSWDRTVRVWSPSTGEQKAAFDWERGKVQYVAVAPDGMTAAAACDKGVVVWDLD